MADAKLSALPSASDTTGAVFYGVQGGTSKKFAASLFGSGDASDIAFTPAGGISATDVQAAIEELDGEKLSVTAAAAGYQPLDSDLTAIAGLSTTTFGRSLLTQTAAEDARNTLDVAPYVATRTALKALDTSKDTVAILTESGREGVFVWVLGDYTAFHAADTEQGIFVKASAVASNTGSWVRAYAEAVNAKWFGAVGDNSTFDSTALQCWVDVAALVGATAYAPGGSYVVNDTIIIPPAPTSAPPRPYCSIRGAGKGATAFRVRAADDIPVFSYSGSLTGSGISAFTTFEKFTVTSGGAGTQKFGFLIDNAAFFAVRDVAFSGLTVGVQATDVLSCEFQSCELRFNGGGFNFQTGDASPPNNITILDCEIGANTDYAIYAYQPSNLRIIGGAIEGNGNGAGDIAVTVIDGGYGGGNGLFMEGVYVEANTGDADVWIDQNSGLACSHWIAGNTFSRVGNTNYVTNNIKLTCDTATAFAPTIMSNGFKGFGGYTPNAGRLYVDTSGCAGTAWSVLYESNLFKSATEAPKLGPRVTSIANINLASQFDTRAPQHVASRWYAPMPLNTSANSAFGQNVIGLQMFTLGDTVTIDQLGTYISTLSAGGNLQLAIYANDPATAHPTGQPLLKTGNISTAATGVVSAAVVANAQLTPGLYWMAAMMDNATAAVVGYQGAMPLQPYFSGSATLTDLALSSTVFGFIIRVTNTFGSGWPDLTSATKTVTPGTLAPVVFFHTASVP